MRTSLVIGGLVAAGLYLAVGFNLPGNRMVHLANVVQTNKLPMAALSRYKIQAMGVGGAWIEGISVPALQAGLARKIVIEDWKAHHYCMTLSEGKAGWLHFDGATADPKEYSYPYSPAFLKERSEAAAEFGRRLKARGHAGAAGVGK